MRFSDVIGQQAVKERLRLSARKNRVAHTQLFLGPEGSGALPLAIALAQYLSCTHKKDNDSCGNCPSCIKYQRFAHPDLHFIFPTTTNDKVKKNPQSELFQEEWLNFIRKNRGYATQSSWYETLGAGNKQGTIYARDANEIVRLISLKPYEAAYKVVIIFQAERLNAAASNKLLKSFEEPPDNTLFILVADRYELIIPTVRSRAQLVKVPKLKIAEVEDALLKRFSEKLTAEKARELASLAQGNWNVAIDLMDQADENEHNFVKFRNWMRLCFRGNDFVALSVIIQELSRMGREKQKGFLNYGLQVIHNSLIINWKQEMPIVAHASEKDYLRKFAPYVNSANQKQMYELLNEAVYHVERNAHPGILFADLSFKLTELMQAGKKAM